MKRWLPKLTKSDKTDENRQLRRRFSRAITLVKYKSGRQWSIPFEKWLKFINSPCYYCNILSKTKVGTGLDRINNSYGYHIDNVLPCCRSCNVTRGDRFTVQETKVMINALQNFRSQKL